MSADEQADKLKATGVTAVYSLGGGKRLRKITWTELDKLATAPGRVFRLIYAFLLAEPAKQTPAFRRRFKTAVRALTEKRPGVIEEVDSGLTTAIPGQKRAMMALANETIRRSCQGARAIRVAEARKGRQLTEFSAEQITEARIIWRDLYDYPTWQSASVELAKIITPKGEKFTTARARKLFGLRKSRSR